MNWLQSWLKWIYEFVVRWAVLGLVVLGVGILWTGVLIGQLFNIPSPLEMTAWACLTALFGIGVGASEIVSRYRDEPFQSVLTPYGGLYVCLNGGISLAAFWILLRYSEGLLPGIRGDFFLISIFAGFGAMTLMRSKLFTFRAEDGTEYGIGPAIVLESALKTLDRKIDRGRAVLRQKRVLEKTKGIITLVKNDNGQKKLFEQASHFLEASLLSFQNLSKDDKADIASTMKQYREETVWTPALKTMGLGFALLTLMGEENFERVIQDLEDYLKNL